MDIHTHASPSFDDALTSNNDLDNNNDSSMRSIFTFTATAAPRKTKFKASNNLANAATTDATVPGVVVKKGTNKMVADNSMPRGAYMARQESLMKEEESGRLKFVFVSNDGVDEHMIWLTGLKNIFAKQLSNMPKVYIVRLLMDSVDKSVLVIRQNQVVGGITYRPFHLKTLSVRVESERHYVTLEMFLADVRRMFVNARTYNTSGTIYIKWANRHAYKPTLKEKCQRGSYLVEKFSRGTPIDMLYLC